MATPVIAGPRSVPTPLLTSYRPATAPWLPEGMTCMRSA